MGTKIIKTKQWIKEFSEVTSPFKLKLPEKKLSKEELISAIRQSIIAEHDAIVLYESYANATNDSSAREIFQHVADEEKVHVGEFQELLEKIAGKAEGDFIEEGRQEARENI